MMFIAPESVDLFINTVMERIGQFSSSTLSRRAPHIQGLLT